MRIINNMKQDNRILIIIILSMNNTMVYIFTFETILHSLYECFYSLHRQIFFFSFTITGDSFPQYRKSIKCSEFPAADFITLVDIHSFATSRHVFQTSVLIQQPSTTFQISENVKPYKTKLSIFPLRLVSNSKFLYQIKIIKLSYRVYANNSKEQ